MRYVLAVVLVAIYAVSTLGAPAMELKTDEQKFCYLLGRQMGHSLKQYPVKMDMDALARGITDSLSGGDPLMTDAEAEAFVKAYRPTLEKRFAARLEADSKRNIAEGKKFLAANGKRKGVVTTKSGLQYRVVKAGEGPKPKATDNVKVHYTGKLLDGKVFDSSRKRGRPASFGLNGVIRGWTEGLQLMPVGSTFEFVIPSSMAYAEQGKPPTILPNSTLVFEVELIEIVKQ